MSTNIGLKFNNGNTALVWTGSGMATLESLGLATRAWVERLQKQVDETTAELAAESEMVAALQAQLAAHAEMHVRAVAAAREEQREVIARAARCCRNQGPCETTSASIRATPLGATPLRERIAELEALQASTKAWAHGLQSDRDAFEAERDALKARVAEADTAWRDEADRHTATTIRAEAAEARVKELEQDVARSTAGPLEVQLAETKAREARLAKALEGVAKCEVRATDCALCRANAAAALAEKPENTRSDT